MANKRNQRRQTRRRYKGGKPRTRAAKRAQARAQQQRNNQNVVANNRVGNNQNMVANNRVGNNQGIANTPPANVIPEPNAVHNVTNVANAGLPEGWRKEQMTNHPAVVWYEKNNGGEQWYPPGAEENDPTMFTNDSTLPEGWRKAYHRDNNVDPKLYWYVSPNNQTSWTRPDSSNGSLNDPTNIPSASNAPSNTPANNTPANNTPANNTSTNNPTNIPLAPVEHNTLNQRVNNLSPNIQGQLNRIKQKITNINQSLRSFTPGQAGGRRFRRA